MKCPGLITDGLGATGYRGRVAERLVDIDLGKEYMVSHIGMTSYLKTQLFCPDEFELRYWDNGWKTVERKQADHKGYLVFRECPGSIADVEKLSLEKERRQSVYLLMKKEM